ncbi:MAG: short-chain dehydrogenase [Chitinophagaceae bacterium]
MTTEQIEKYVKKTTGVSPLISIHFKDRQTVTGVFIQMPDYTELKSKNLWRVVRLSHLDEWEKTRNPHLNRIFNGMSFTRLSEESKK